MERLDCVVVGAGVVGLAVARSLALTGREVVVVETESQVGAHSSSRNSEVIHAGIYYPPGSLKARHCVAGKHQLYAYCAERGIAHRRIGKIIVATDEGLGIPIVIWANGGLKQIQDDMRARSIDLVGVTGRNPDFVLLARSMGADGVVAESVDHAVAEVKAGLAKDRPTVIVVEEDSPWLS